MTETAVYSPIQWVPITLTCGIFSMINFIMLKSEISSRKASTTKFTTKSLKYSSISCISFGFLSLFTLFLSHFDGFCHFGILLKDIFVQIQLLSMGFYQISRLYYSFSNEQIHSNKGYPKWLFNLMITIGVFLCINFPLSSILSPHIVSLKSECYVNTKFQYVAISADPDFGVAGQYGLIWFIFVSILYIVWDISTLLLYACKIRSFRQFKESQPIVYKRIVSILQKIFFLSLFYEIVTVICIFILIIFGLIGLDSHVFDVLAAVLACFVPLAFSCSIYFMMEHNRDKYVTFLRYIHCFRLYLCCCCCGHIFIDQLEDLDGESQKLSVDQKAHQNDEKSYDSTKTCTLSSTNSLEMERDFKTGCECSMEMTVTVQ